MQDQEPTRGGKLNTKTFAIRDSSGTIYVCVPVLLYKESDAGYHEMAAYFNRMDTGDSVTLNSGWCSLLPQNSSTNDITGTDDSGGGDDGDDY